MRQGLGVRCAKLVNGRGEFVEWIFTSAVSHQIDDHEHRDFLGQHHDCVSRRIDLDASSAAPFAARNLFVDTPTT